MGRSKQRSREAVRLAAAGLGFAEIAEHLGYADESGPRKAVERRLAKIDRVNVETIRSAQTLGHAESLQRLGEAMALVSAALVDAERREVAPLAHALSRLAAEYRQTLEAVARMYGQRDDGSAELSHIRQFVEAWKVHGTV